MDIFDFPIIIEKDSQYLSAFNERAESFFNYLKKLTERKHLSDYKSEINEALSVAKKIKANIVKAFNCQFNGQSEKGAHFISNMIKRNKEKLVVDLFNCYAFRGMDYYKGGDRPLSELFLYKGRADEKEVYKNYSRKEMFHIPLSHREKISTKRFSMPGIPCIYLTQNSYVVWKELNMPSFDKLSISTFKLTNRKPLQIIDLTYPVAEVAKILEDKEKFKLEYKKIGHYDPAKIVISSLVLFILIAAVSIKCKDQNRTFRSEYVIPQLFMHALSLDKDVIGIAYHSNEIPTSTCLPATNLAIPIIDYDQRSDYGNIKEYIELTEPVNFDYYNTVCKNSKSSATPEGNHLRSTFNTVFSKEISNGSYDGLVKYDQTPFFFFDDYILNAKEFKSIMEES